ncbi:MAG: helix-turn-helix domain-containing protein [Candidatus Puniceispirillaceae bacterium]
MEKHIGTFNVQSLADYFKVDRNTIYRWRREGQLPDGNKVGQKRRWSAQQLANHTSPQCELFKEENGSGAS